MDKRRHAARFMLSFRRMHRYDLFGNCIEKASHVVQRHLLPALHARTGQLARDMESCPPYKLGEGQPVTCVCRAIVAALAWCLLSAHSSIAQGAPGMWPRCIAERDGQQLALAGSVCECASEQGGTMTGKRPGWRWDCDIMRSDGSQLEIPADTSSGQQSLPPGFTYAPQGGTSMQPGLQDQPFGRPYGAQPPGPMPLFGGRRRQ